MSDKYLISVIVPVFNVGRCLNRCLKSLQDNRIEIVLVDDGSTDESYEICKEFSKMNNNCIVIHQENNGVSSARNKGIELAHGKWICFVDADDYVVDNWIDELQEKVDLYAAEDVYILGKDIEDKKYSGVSCVKAIWGESDELGSSGDSLCWVFSKLYSRKFLLDKNIKFVEGLINGEDMLFNCNVFINAQSVVGFNLSYYCFFKNLQSSTNKFNPKIIDTELLFHKALSEFMIKYQLNNEQWTDIYERTLLTGIYGVIYRIAIAKEQVSSKLVYDILSRDEYKKALHNLDKHKSRLSKRQVLVIAPLKNKKAHKALIRMKCICKLKRFYYKKEGIIVNI